MAAAQRLEPIYNALRELVKDSYYVMADEKPHPVLESDRPGALHRGYMWNFYLPRLDVYKRQREYRAKPQRPHANGRTE